MYKIKNQKMPSKLGTINSLEPAINAGISARLTSMMTMGGYPQSRHIVGKIQSMINLNSFLEMMISLITIRDLARLASDVLSSITLARVDRAQMRRDELLAYIQMVADNMRQVLTEDDRETIAYMIVSAESTESQWTLEFSPDETQNVYLKFANMYASAAPGSGTKIDISPDKVKYDNNGLAYVFSPTGENMISVAQTAYAKNLATSWRKLKKDTDKEYIIKKLQADVTLKTMANIRVIDHVLHLYTSTDAWDSFISPRNSTDSDANKARAHSLRLFAGYIQSLLVYPYISAMEFNMKVYNNIQVQFFQFPPLSGNILARYEDAIRDHDVLGAGADIDHVLSLYPDQNSDGSNITVLLEESLYLLDIGEALRALAEAKGRAVTPITTIDLANLNDPAYNYLTLSQAVTELDMFEDVTQKLYTGDVMKETIRQGIAAMLPFLPMFQSLDVTDELRRIGFTLPYPLSFKIPSWAEIEATSSPHVMDNSFKFRFAVPAHTKDYRFFMRRTMVNRVFKVSDIINATSTLMPKVGINYDHSKKLQGIIAETYHSLYPSGMIDGEDEITLTLLKSNTEYKRRFFERLANAQFATIERTIAGVSQRRVWATMLSSFASFYVVERAEDLATLISNNGDISTVLSAFMVKGYGHPYGTTYEDLVSKQGSRKADEILRITDTTFLIMHQNIPAPTATLAADPAFYDTHPVYYFKSNSVLLFEKVDKWVFAEAMLNFSLYPLPAQPRVPAIVFDRKWAYFNDEIVAQFQLNYIPPQPSDSVASITIPKTTVDWRYARFYKFLDFVSFPPYGSSTTGRLDKGTSDKENQITEMIKETEIAIKTIDDQSLSKDLSKVSPQTITQIPVEKLDGDMKSEKDLKPRSPHKDKAKAEHGKEENTEDKNESKSLDKLKSALGGSDVEDEDDDKKKKKKK